MCYTDINGKKVCENQTKYCKEKYGCAQRKCTKWEKIDDVFGPNMVPGGASGAIRG